ncbi:FAD-dependent monooxygenase [Allokutzneria sp. A3M-2-11 16]|uniref:FAD-dependent monooxygenase n=1 Tax=Allokutzneria sp. A3M-2-11 16 TaxID=2962043 RepID=UPI0020B693BF|nr:FAD-dependent monooxygenase [Allokutzneria sp. A3M-2-11 16]MCP3805166.1 FAD-dependent monooxygenase [Allokutzneria sp. A3M-2-11 16]
MRAVVVGGGIGGLASAVALTRSGWQVEVLERAAEFGEVGAGLAVQPNALRALDALGLGDAVRERASTEAPAGIRAPSGRWLSRTDPGELRRRYGQWAMVHRADLLEILHAAIPADALRPGVDVHEVRRDGTVLHSGGTSTGDLVVGADGIRSITRRSVWGEAPAPRYAGYSTWRAISNVPVRESVETWGRGERFGYSPLPDGRTYFYAVVNAPEGEEGGADELRRRFAHWHDPIPALVNAVEGTALLRHDTYELPNLSSYVAGKAALVGDAAHAMTPNLGQGACQALEDAVVLAAADGLAEYDRLRRPRTQMVVRRSHRLGVIAHWAAPALVGVRNTVLRMLPRSSFSRSMAPVLDWAP